MDQGGGVEHLHASGGEERHIGVRPAQAGRQEDQSRAQPFASASQQKFHCAGNSRMLVRCRFLQEAFCSLKVVLNRVEKRQR
jgi:hypothetical protein